MPLSRPSPNPEAKLTDERNERACRLYRVKQVEMAQLRDFLDEYWAGRLDRLRDVSEMAAREKQRRIQKKKQK